MRSHVIGRSLIALTMIAVASGCFGDENEVVGPKLADAMFGSYVALGNAITAGYQSGGISDATQRQSYAFLLAQQMRTRYAYASLNNPGCPPPIINFQTQARPAGTTGSTCALRGKVTDALNNVAVPGATSYDPTDADGTPFSNTLTSLILGGESQVQRALDARPTFATIWIGTNDVLGFAIADARAAAPTGLAGMTSVATFQANYTAMLDALVAGAPGLEGVLVGVLQVGNLPVMFPALSLSNAAFKAGFDAIANTVTTLDASCLPGSPTAGAVINTFLAFQIRLGNHPPIVACTAGGATGLLPPPVGDILVLDPTEQATVAARVDAFNAHITAEANRIGFAYYDPNPTLATLKTAGTLIRTAPSWAATNTFGTGMSLDGVHPGALVHRELANALIAAINAEYGTTLAPVP